MSMLHAIARENPDSETIPHFKVLLGDGADVNAVDESGSTPLHYAARANPLISDILLQCESVSVDCVNNEGDTPLLIAVREGNADTARQLLTKCANVNVSDKNGMTPLHYALICAEDSIFDLLNKCANVNAVSESGDTPLHTALKYGNLQYVGVLLSKGGNVNASNSKSERPLHVLGRQYVYRAPQYERHRHAKSFGFPDPDDFYFYDCSSEYYSEVIDVLLDHGADIDAQDDFGNTPLHVAVSFCYALMMEKLVRKGCDVNKRNKNNLTALHIAAKYGSLPLAKILLLSKGADTNALSRSNCTPLDLAIKDGHEHVADFLLKQRELIKAANKDDIRLLHLAIAKGRNSVVRNMFARCSDIALFVNSMSDDGLTSLHVAAQHGLIAMVKLLVSFGANVEVVDKTGNTLVYYAKTLDVREFFLQKNVKGKMCPDILPDAVLKDRLDVVLQVLEEGANLNARNDKGMTALHIASLAGNEEIVKLLLEHGADLDTRDPDYGFTALHFAASTINRSVLDILLGNYLNMDIDSLSSIEEFACLDGFEDRLKSIRRNEFYDRGHDGCSCGYRGVPSHDYRRFGPLPSDDSLMVDAGWTPCSEEDIEEDMVYGRTPLCVALEAGCPGNVDYLLIHGADVNSKCVCTLMNDPRFQVCSSFVTHLLCMQKAGLFVNETLLLNIDLDEWPIREIENEIVELKNFRIGCSNATFYDFCVLSPNKMASLLVKENIEENLKSVGGAWSKFPYSRVMVCSRLSFAAERFNLLRDATPLLEETLYRLPDLCIDKLTTYLSNRDLKMIIRAFRE